MSKTPSVNDLNDQLKYWQQLRAQLEIQEGMDVKCLTDTLEGATNLPEALLAVADEIRERECQSDAIKLRIAEMTERKNRIDRTAETLRNIVLRAMDSSGIKTVPGDTATLSVSDLSGELVVENESEIPAKFWKAGDPKLDKAALKKAVSDGEEIPGTRLSNGRISLTIRRK